MFCIATDEAEIKTKGLYVIFVYIGPGCVIVYTFSYLIPSFKRTYYGSLDLTVVELKSLAFVCVFF